jgi:DNA-binding response OmpR family regulator
LKKGETLEADKSLYEALKHYSILIVEDDESALISLANILKRYFKNVLVATNGYEASDCIFSQKIDIILTDVRMPYQDGVDFIKHLRESNIDTPVIFMSAYSDSETLLQAIPLKITDYLIKPIQINQVLGLCQKIFQEKIDKVEKGRIEKYLYELKNGITIDLGDKTVYENGEMILLTKKEFELLSLFLKNRSSILTKTQIEYALWNGEMVSESSVKTLVKKLREKIGEDSIVTVKNLGYKISIH